MSKSGNNNFDKVNIKVKQQSNSVLNHNPVPAAATVQGGSTMLDPNMGISSSTAGQRKASAAPYSHSVDQQQLSLKPQHHSTNPHAGNM